MDIKKALDKIKEPLQVEVKKIQQEPEQEINKEIEKNKKPRTEKQIQALKTAREKRQQYLKVKKEEIKTEIKEELKEEIKEDSLKNKLKKLDQLDDIMRKLNELEQQKKDPIIIPTEKEVEKPEELKLEEDIKKDPIVENPIIIEDTIKEEVKVPFNNFNIRRKLTSISVPPQYKTPILGKNNPFINAFKNI